MTGASTRTSSPTEPTQHRQMGFIYALLQDAPEAERWHRRALQPLRADPRFAALAAGVDARVAAMRQRAAPEQW